MARIVKNPEERKKEIISTAKLLFLENEYDKTTMEEIISKLGIAKGTVYHYFKSKEELRDAVVDSIVDAYLEEMRPALSNTQGNAIQRLQSFLSVDRNLVQTEQATLEKLHKGGNVALHTRQLAVLFAKMAPLIAEVIEAGCHEGHFRTDHPLEAAELLIAGIQFLTDTGVYPWQEADLMRRAKAIPALMEAQLGASKGTFAFLSQKLENL